MKTLLLIYFTVVTLSLNNALIPTLNNSKNLKLQVSYKGCIDFKFEADSEDCEFIKKINSDLKALKNVNKEYYITRYINEVSKQIDSYEIVGFKEGESIYIDHNQEVGAYIIYLQKNNSHIIVYDFYD
ncbi:hypothetical protein [uncultured Dokdonia sp.]|uniref:hypothetical protein n=1 Tax=uncultured Dokdonia sp. TaxID=575653 RepID=UPI00262078BB|nr:hypothetical protein [uncultured Dokdonia sp.]